MAHRIPSQAGNPADFEAPCSGSTHVPTGRLRRRKEFMALRRGHRRDCGSFILQGARRQDPQSESSLVVRFGYTVTKKTGKAVIRNRIRRRLREAVRLASIPRELAGHDFVLVARTPALSQDFSEMRRRLETALQRIAAGDGTSKVRR